MAILTAGERLTREAIPVEIRVQRDPAPRSSVQEARESAERDHILRALEEANWNVSGAARALGMERTNLHKRIRALGLSRGNKPVGQAVSPASLSGDPEKGFGESA
jgi:two-component system nitrogen regulation response regulator NtrX